MAASTAAAALGAARPAAVRRAQQRALPARAGSAPLGRRVVPRAQASKKEYGSFDDMLRSGGKPTLVDFYATWCGPCVMMSKILSDMSPQLKEKVQMVKIDTDKYPRIASQYRIEGLPTLVLFSEDGKVLDRMEGVVQGPQLVERVNYFLAGLESQQAEST